MIYRVCEHYYNDDCSIINYKLDTEQEVEECFICLQITNENDLKPVTLKNQHLYIKNCNCNGWIHQKCLEIWCIKNMTCPICRMQLQENIQIKHMFFFISYRTHILYLKMIRILKRIARLTTIFFIIYISFEYFYFLYFIKNLTKESNEHYSYIPDSEFNLINLEIIKNITDNH